MITTNRNHGHESVVMWWQAGGKAVALAFDEVIGYGVLQKFVPLIRSR
ncbi:hypothetical protein OG339_48335 (plasmid) [Streptosporangium sp. NBC_01495]|nr:hypothetical protein [Streptosporangium sp. NBC_01495]